MRNHLRRALRTRYLPSKGIRRAHIIGCARSGTTMLHYAMAAFEHVTLNAVESNLRYTPSILQSLSLGRQPRGSWLITKREFGWFEPRAVEDMIHFAIEENISLIHLVRDPRDVLVSRHAGNDHNEFYVNPERWSDSVRAGHTVMEAVAGKVPTLTLRYEDMVHDADVCEARLVNELGFRKNPMLGRLSQLADNLQKTGIQANPWMKKALHRLRNFDQRSVGAWHQQPQKRDYLRNLLDTHPELRREIIEFMQTHGYEYTQDVREMAS